MIQDKEPPQNQGMSRRRKKSTLALAALVILIAIIGGGLALRWKMRQAAIGYGLELQSALFEQQDTQAGAAPRQQRDIFNEPKMQEFDRTLRSTWGFVGVDYLERAEELRLGITYLHAQRVQPNGGRFTNPPKLRHFTLDPGDKDDRSIQRALRTLMEDYLGAVGSR